MAVVVGDERAHAGRLAVGDRPELQDLIGVRGFDTVADQHRGVVLLGLDEPQVARRPASSTVTASSAVEDLGHHVVGRGVGVAGHDEGATHDDDRRGDRRRRDPPASPVDRDDRSDVRFGRRRWLERRSEIAHQRCRGGTDLRFAGNRFEDGGAQPGRRSFGDRLGESGGVVEHGGVLRRGLWIVGQ